MNPEAPLRVAIVGPGRLGSAIGRRWHEAGLTLLGYVGRTPSSAATACEFAGTGEALSVEDLLRADAVLLAVQDDGLVGLAKDLGQALAERVSAVVWLHASGSHGLEALQPLAAFGASIAAMHPTCPLPDAQRGYQNLAGQPCVVMVAGSDVVGEKTLCTLSEAAGLHPLLTAGGDRLVYHAACVLAANGLTALYSVVEELLSQALPDVDTQRITPALMQTALETCLRTNPKDALSGPVLRGDAGLVEKQRQVLAAQDPAVDDIYRALMWRAAEMARDRGALAGASLEEIRRVLTVDA